MSHDTTLWPVSEFRSIVIEDGDREPMQIRNIFEKDLFRPINGVVKADQQDEAIVWQELDEYVVTRELDKHFRKFFDAYLAAIDNPSDPIIAGKMGVWVSGFFGSGKSHFIKILSYLLNNRLVCNPKKPVEQKRAIEYCGRPANLPKTAVIQSAMS